MSSKKTSKEENVDGIDATGLPSVDDFIKELEEKERDLHISSDLVIEVGESSVEHDNIHDSFVPTLTITPGSAKAKKSGESSVEFEEDSTDDDDLVQMRERIEELNSEKDDLIDSLRRQKFDFDNYKHRTERDRKDTFKNILGSLAMQILPVLDNLDRALDSTIDAEEFQDPDLQKFIEGIVLVNQQMREVLVEMGVQPINSLGELFDPNLHDAVDCIVTDEAPPDTVLQELLIGYKIEDRVIRPSVVKVSASKGTEDSSEDPA